MYPARERSSERTDVERAGADCRYMPAVAAAVERALRRVEQLTHCRTGHGEVSREPVAEEDHHRRHHRRRRQWKKSNRRPGSAHYTRRPLSSILVVRLFRHRAEPSRATSSGVNQSVRRTVQVQENRTRGVNEPLNGRSRRPH